MRMDKLTSRFQQAIADAQSLAVGRDHTIVEPAHLLLALIDQQGGGTRPLLSQAGVNVPVLRERLAMMEAKFGFDPKGHTGKALTHALTALPHDLTAAFQPDQLERLALTAMGRAGATAPTPAWEPEVDLSSLEPEAEAA